MPEGNDEHEGDREQRDRERPVDESSAAPPAERLRRRPAAHRRDDRDEQHAERVDLDAAGGRAGRAADEHQRHRHEQRGLAERAVVDDANPALRSVTDSKSALSGRYSTGIAPSVAGFDHSSAPSRTAPPTRRTSVVSRTTFVSRARRPQRRLPTDVADDREPEPAEDDQDADRHEDHRARREVREAPEAAGQVEARVVERGDRVEHAPPRRLHGVSPVGEERGEQDRRRPPPRRSA